MASPSTPKSSRTATRRVSTTDDSSSDEEEGAMSVMSQLEEPEESVCESTYADLNPNETRRILNEMIETCQELDEKSAFQAKEDIILREQVKHSKIMFETQFVIPSFDSSGRSTKRRSLGNTMISNNSTASDDSVTLSQAQDSIVVADARPSDIYLSYKHTQICAGLVHKRTLALGTTDETITLDAYLKSVRKLGMKNGVYDRELAMEQGCKIAETCCKSVPGLKIMLGATDFKENVVKGEKPVKKEVVRTKRTNFDLGTLIPTQETINISPESTQAKAKTNEETSTAFRRNLTTFCKDGNPNVFEFTLNKDSIRETLNNTFGVAFGVRDGYIALNQEGTQYKIAATEPPQKSLDDTENTNMQKRKQCIVSISSAQLRKMQEMAVGENAIKTKSGKSTK